MSRELFEIAGRAEPGSEGPLGKLGGCEVVNLQFAPLRPEERRFVVPMDERHALEMTCKVVVRPGDGRGPWKRPARDEEVIEGLRAALTVAGRRDEAAGEVSAGWMCDWERARDEREEGVSDGE